MVRETRGGVGERDIKKSIERSLLTDLLLFRSLLLKGGIDLVNPKYN